MFIRDLLKALSDAEVPYCVVGGVAVNLHGIPRMTYDVDIAVPTTADALGRADAVLVGLGLVCRLPLRLVDLADDRLRAEYREERNLIAVTYTDPRDPLREVDILISPPIPATDLVRRAVAIDLDGVVARVIELDDLIALKRDTGRAQDAADIEHLERIKGQRG